MAGINNVHLLAFKRALATYTRLPVNVEWQTPISPAWSIAYLPWVGMVVAVLSAAPLLVSSWSESLQALFMILVAMLITGAFHEDGLLDSVDGLFGGWSPDQRLSIMKDSRVGSFGVLAAWTVLSLKWWLLSEWIRVAQWEQGIWVVFWGWIAVHVTARWLPLIFIQFSNYLASEGSKSASWIERQGMPQWLVLASGVLVVWLMVGTLSFSLICLSVLLLAVALILYVKSKIGGYNGDVLGASEQLGEVVVLFALLGWSA